MFLLSLDLSLFFKLVSCFPLYANGCRCVVIIIIIIIVWRKRTNISKDDVSTMSARHNYNLHITSRDLVTLTFDFSTPTLHHQLYSLVFFVFVKLDSL